MGLRLGFMAGYTIDSRPRDSQDKDKADGGSMRFVEYDVCLRICCVAYVCARREGRYSTTRVQERKMRVKRARRTRGAIDRKKE